MKKNALVFIMVVKYPHVISGVAILLLSVLVFNGIQAAKSYANAGISDYEKPTSGSAAISNPPTPTQAAIYGMSLEIALWSSILEVITMMGGAVSIIILGYGLVSKDTDKQEIHVD